VSLADPPKPALENIECEAALIGAIMFDNRTVDYAADRITPEDFADPLLARVFGVCVSEYSQGRPVSPVTLRPFFVNDPGFEGVNPAVFLSNLMGSGGVVIGIEAFVDQVASLASRRRLVAGLNEAIALASDPSATATQLIDAADGALLEATAKGDPVKTATAGATARRYMENYGKGAKIVASGSIPSIDRLISPRPTDLIIGAGRPGMGKTATAVSYSVGCAKAGHGVAFFSLEMGAEQLVHRALADLCFNGHGGIPYSAIVDETLTNPQKLEIARAAEYLDTLPLTIVDAPRLTIGALGRRVRRLKRRMAAKGQSLDVVVVDYLQLLSGSGHGANRNEVVAEISRELKAIAKEHDVVMFALSQLSREVEKRDDKRPKLSDLRESGQIEQDADAVLFFYRHEYYMDAAEPPEGHKDRPQWEVDRRNCAGIIDFIGAKVRRSTTGSRQGQFWGGNQAVRG
jgi:replicative DNA helicase